MNLMKYIPNIVSSKIGRSILLTQKHSPVILFGVGIVGVVGTVVLASRATLKLDETLDQTEKNVQWAKEQRKMNQESYSEREYQKDVALQYVRAVGSITRLYGPSVVVGITSIGCLGGSHAILSRRNASLMTAYSLLQKGFDEYRGRVIEAVGPDKERELRFGSESHEIIEETDAGHKVSEIKRIGPNGEMIYARIFSQATSGTWSAEPSYNISLLRLQQSYANDRLHSRGHLFLNEVYEMLGLDWTTAGQIVGWVMNNGDNYVDFGFNNADTRESRDFIFNNNGSILLDFNVDGPVYKLIDKKKDEK